MINWVVRKHLWMIWNNLDFRMHSFQTKYYSKSSTYNYHVNIQLTSCKRSRQFYSTVPKHFCCIRSSIKPFDDYLTNLFVVFHQYLVWPINCLLNEIRNAGWETSVMTGSINRNSGTKPVLLFIITKNSSYNSIAAQINELKPFT